MASELNRYVGVTDCAARRGEVGGISDLVPTQWKGALNRSRQRYCRHEVTADGVAQDFLDLALVRCATGSFATVDGGNIAAAPR
jgi:hypothetical protein